LRRLGFYKAVRICDLCEKEVLIEESFAAEHLNLIVEVHIDSEVHKEWTLIVNNKALLENKIYYGIPAGARRLVWTVLCEANVIMKKNEGLYDMFRLNGDVDEEIMKAISLDIPRTFPESPLFGPEDAPGRKLLSNVLHAYSRFDPEIGYCQGISFLGGVLLMHMTEEESFWVLVQILKKYKIGCVFNDDNVILDNFANKFMEMFPVLGGHIENSGGCPVSVFVLQWIRTLFSIDLDYYILFRIWDIFFYKGSDFIVNLILALFYFGEVKILTLEAGELLIHIKSLTQMLKTNYDSIIEYALSL